jgi:ABC-2 type transport system ATP-binding protein
MQTQNVTSSDSATKSQAAIQTQKLTKYYGSVRGVVDLDLEVAEGEVFGFIGPNGSGKTTTIRLITDLIRPTRGSATVFGMDSRADSVAIKRLIGYLPGELSLWNNLTGAETCQYLGNLRGGVDPKYIEELAARFDLDLRKKFRAYSKGNKQKVGIIQAFMHKPRLLILDEPTSGLDPLNQQEFYKLLAEHRAGGATVFLSSHIFEEVEHTCQRVAIIREGQLVRVATITDIINEKAHRIEISFDQPVNPDEFKQIAGVTSVEASDDNKLIVNVQGSVAPVIQAAAQHNIVNLITHEPTLEEAFLQYYQRS